MINYQHTEFQSSNLICCDWNGETKTLTLEFANGKYRYTEVLFEHYLEFISAESNGSAFNKIIRKNYTAQRLENDN